MYPAVLGNVKLRGLADTSVVVVVPFDRNGLADLDVTFDGFMLVVAEMNLVRQVR